MRGDGKPVLQVPSAASFLLLVTGPAVLFKFSQFSLPGTARMGGAREASSQSAGLPPF